MAFMLLLLFLENNIFWQFYSIYFWKKIHNNNNNKHRVFKYNKVIITICKMSILYIREELLILFPRKYRRIKLEKWVEWEYLN